MDAPLTTARRARDVSKAALAHRSGLHQRTISHLARRGAPRAVRDAIALARQLDTTVEALFGHALLGLAPRPKRRNAGKAARPPRPATSSEAPGSSGYIASKYSSSRVELPARLAWPQGPFATRVLSAVAPVRPKPPPPSPLTDCPLRVGRAEVCALRTGRLGMPTPARK